MSSTHSPRRSSSSSFSQLLLHLRKPTKDDPEPKFIPFNLNDAQDVLAVAPPPSVFVDLKEAADGAPTVAEGAIHLLLLEAFWTFKQRFLRPSSEVTEFFESALAGTASGEMVWKIVGELAVARFEAWWKAVGREMGREGGEGGAPEDGPGERLTILPAEMLPPIDVLMVWQSFMLNPRCYYDDCHALGVPGMLSVLFPWEVVVSFHHITSYLSILI